MGLTNSQIAIFVILLISKDALQEMVLTAAGPSVDAHWHILMYHPPAWAVQADGGLGDLVTKCGIVWFVSKDTTNLITLPWGRRMSSHISKHDTIFNKKNNRKKWLSPLFVVGGIGKPYMRETSNICLKKNPHYCGALCTGPVITMQLIMVWFTPCLLLCIFAYYILQ